ncbi:hypothetical protein U1Q18_032367 [Sarracenia purpurea var. burkii]
MNRESLQSWQFDIGAGNAPERARGESAENSRAPATDLGDENPSGGEEGENSRGENGSFQELNPEIQQYEGGVQCAFA